MRVDFAAFSAGLVESELFGHVRGAFTGALEKRIGRFELADGGTILLDEVGELPLETQVELLAATNRNLEEDVKAGRFRSDLFYRLYVFPLEMPPLRVRRADIPLLAMFYLMRFCRKFGKRVDSIAQETMDRLLNYSWPGNVRELQNVVERAATTYRSSVPDRSPAPHQIWWPAGTYGSHENLSAAEQTSQQALVLRNRR